MQLPGLLGACLSGHARHNVTQTTLSFIKYQPGTSDARVTDARGGQYSLDRATDQPLAGHHRTALPGPAAELGQPARAARADATRRRGAEVPGPDGDLAGLAATRRRAGPFAQRARSRRRRPGHDPDAEQARI